MYKKINIIYFDWEILSKKEKVVETLNNYYKNAVRLLTIQKRKSG